MDHGMEPNAYFWSVHSCAWAVMVSFLTPCRLHGAYNGTDLGLNGPLDVL